MFTKRFLGAAGSRDVLGRVRWEDRHLLLWVVNSCFPQEDGKVKGDEMKTRRKIPWQETPFRGQSRTGGVSSLPGNVFIEKRVMV